MAIEKEIELPCGLSANYISIARIDIISKIDVTVFVKIYASRQARIDGKSHVSAANYTIKLPIDFNQNIYAYCYEKLKELPEFAGATDV